MLTFPELMEFSIIGGPLKFLHWAFLSMFVKLSRLEEGKKKKKGEFENLQTREFPLLILVVSKKKTRQKWKWKEKKEKRE